MTLKERIAAVVQMVDRLGKEAEASVGKHWAASKRYFDYAGFFMVKVAKDAEHDPMTDDDTHPDKLVAILREIQQLCSDTAQAYTRMATAMETCITMVEEK